MTPTVVFIGGTSGSGKTTVARQLAEEINGRFIEGDDFHPMRSIQKMSTGMPLNDADRMGWLEDLCIAIKVALLDECQTLVVSCSMLKNKYRTYLRKKVRKRCDVTLFMLYCPHDLAFDRMSKRTGHFMKPYMLESQFRDLELPMKEEPKTYTLPVEDNSPEDLVMEARIMLGKI